MSGIAYPGELLAILGSSGSGKTTLLNALNFRSSTNITVTGTRCVNDVPVASRSLTSQSAYVQQDDLFIGTLTVREHLVFQVNPHDIHQFQRIDFQISRRFCEWINTSPLKEGCSVLMKSLRRCVNIYNSWGIHHYLNNFIYPQLSLNKCENTRIGTPGRVKGISGGEQKRLSFASEVLTNPPLMFCDEPTSGLDSFIALNVVQVLKGMAQSGKTVICTIHQPSSELYAMFDKLLLMAEGRVAFLGTPEEADLFFTE